MYQASFEVFLPDLAYFRFKVSVSLKAKHNFAMHIKHDHKILIKKFIVVKLFGSLTNKNMKDKIVKILIIVIFTTTKKIINRLFSSLKPKSFM